MSACQNRVEEECRHRVVSPRCREECRQVQVCDISHSITCDHTLLVLFIAGAAVHQSVPEGVQDSGGGSLPDQVLSSDSPGGSDLSVQEGGPERQHEVMVLDKTKMIFSDGFLFLAPAQDLLAAELKEGLLDFEEALVSLLELTLTLVLVLVQELEGADGTVLERIANRNSSGTPGFIFESLLVHHQYVIHHYYACIRQECRDVPQEGCITVPQEECEQVQETQCDAGQQNIVTTCEVMRLS